MKTIFKLAVLLGLLFSGITAAAQAGKIPPFKMVQANGNVFYAQQLPPGKPVVLIYFLPDCDHCEKLMKELLKNEANLKQASIAMITYLPVEKVSAFVKKYSLQKYPNIYIGTEGFSFYVKNYYGLTELPFAALYTKNGDFVKSYTREVPLPELSEKLSRLK